ncbi:hypothetical protein [Marinomonas sp. THO17]|uniref:hypothetical protein n=1 Tax=Marinomonas sp. THO17 TaxID=3149048 RepID=UPI00336C1B4C
MASQANQDTLPVIQYPLYGDSERIIIHQQDDVMILHERLSQEATPTRLYQPAQASFLFLLTGEVHVQSQQHAVNIKAQQGVWFPINQTSVLTLLTPSASLCVIRFNKMKANSILPDTLQKVSSGAVDSQIEKKQVQVWPLWETKETRISIEKYPAKYSEAIYYQKNAMHYILPLQGQAYLANKQAAASLCSEWGQVIPAKRASAVLNPNEEVVILLSLVISKKAQLKGRVIVLNRPNSLS